MSEWEADGEPIWRDRRFPYAVLVILLLVAGLVLWQNLNDDRPEATAGAGIKAADPIAVAKHWTVRLPGDELDVGVSGLLDDVPGDFAARGYQAPDDGSFLGLTVTENPDPVVDLPAFGAYHGPPKTSLQLDTGAHTYQVTNSSDVFGESDFPIAIYLPVAGHPDSLRLIVTFGARTQSIDLRTGARKAGDFADLYAKRGEFASCGTTQFSKGYRADYRAAACRFVADRYSYVSGKGWAPAGRSWLVVRVALTQPKGAVHIPDGQRFYLGSSQISARPCRLDGAKPLDAHTDGVAGNAVSSLFSVAGKADTGHVLAVVQESYLFARIERAAHEYSPTITETWTVKIP